MNEMFRQSLFAGVTISLIAYEIGLFLKRKLGLAILNPLLVIVPMQMLAYNVAKLKNCDIDKPRNLAKSVTVE